MGDIFRMLHIVHLYISLTTAQTTICVWNSIDEWDHINGNYIRQSNTYNGESYWKQAPTGSSTSDCPENPHYIYAATYKQQPYWQIKPIRITTYVDHYPVCDDPYDLKTIPSDPTQCVGGYYVWTSDTSRTELPLTIIKGVCPSIPCSQIKITNTASSQCDATFHIADGTAPNVYSNADGIWFFFNYYAQFKWYCSAKSNKWSDCDGSISNNIVVAKNSVWKDVNVGETLNIQMDNGLTADIQCMEYNDSTTLKPTAKPTMNPTEKRETKQPTNIVTLSLTKAPTITTKAPTNKPTSRPTLKLTSAIYFGDGYDDYTNELLQNERKASSLITAAIVIFIIGCLCCCCVSKIEYYFRKTPPKMERYATTEAPSSEIQMSNTKETDTRKSEVMMWLDGFGLVQYCTLFIEHGFDSLHVIKVISNISDLESMGIKDDAHRKLIFSRIQMLNPMMHKESAMIGEMEYTYPSYMAEGIMKGGPGRASDVMSWKKQRSAKNAYKDLVDDNGDKNAEELYNNEEQLWVTPMGDDDDDDY